jgi:predicted HTH domain antitoxin
MQIAIDLPNDFVAFQAVPDIQQEVRTSYALWLYQRERVTLAKAAELAGVSLYDFMNLCKTNRIPVIDITRDELLEEMAGF